MTAALDPKNLLVGKEFECDMDNVYDVMGKYLLENLLCLHPAEENAEETVGVDAEEGQGGTDGECVAAGDDKQGNADF